MTLSSADFLRLPYSPDLTEGGIAYALRALAREKILPNRLIRMTAEIAAELALRRYLTLQDAAFAVAPVLSFEDSFKYPVALDGRRCRLHSFLISRPAQMEAARRAPELLLNAPALVPADMDFAEGRADSDVYIFAFVFGSPSPPAQPPHCFLHVLPEWWKTPAHWNPLGELVLKSESNLRVEAELCGLDETRGFLSRRLILPPRMKVRATESFYSLACLRLDSLPAARLGISIQKQTYLIAPQDWKEIWLRGAEILFAGYLPRGEFRRRAQPVPPGARVFQYDRTRFKNLAVPVSALRPMRELLERARS